MATHMSRRQAGERNSRTVRRTVQSIVSYQSRCSAECIRELAIDPGIGQFTRFNNTLERERLLDIARSPEGCATLAYTADGVIVGYVVVGPPDPRDRWSNIKGVYEMRAIEVSRNWRGRGIGQRLLREAFAEPVWDRRIVFATAYAWHWDLAGTGLTKVDYAGMLVSLVHTAGFLPFETDEPNIRWDEANKLLVRIGADVSEPLYYSFQSRLFEYRL